MFGYRNAVYNAYQRQVDLYTWDGDGKRIMTSVPSYPYFYYEDNHGAEQSIFSTSITKKSFDTVFDRMKFIKERGLRRLFDNLNPAQQALIDLFYDKNDTDDFTKFPLKIYFIDIEAVGPNGFSKPENPNDPINVITVYDSLSKHYYVWGSDPYDNKAEDLTYYHFQSETRMLDHFLEFMAEDVPDILSGWYSEGYDIPYIINRIERVLGEGESKRLSPYNKIRTRNFLGKFGKMEVNYIIEGVSTVDYKDIYMKFCPVKRESYKLDHIAQIELGASKVDYGDQSLYEFMVNDWQTFVDYNIQDVRLLVQLEEKKQYVQLLRLLAYAGLTTFQAALGTVSIVTGAAAIEARKRNQRLYTQVVNEQEDREEFKGGFVFDPVPGHHKAIASFDATSLYPSTMISLNTSPETKMGKILEILPDKVVIRNRDGIIIDQTHDEFNRFIKKEKIAISRAKVLFTQKKKGILADLVDKFFKKRVQCRNESKKLQLELYDIEEKIRIYEKDHPNS
jgi:DNA polymerase elongation subunit (family B)